ncbi:hypothetical protein V2J09_003958 [Rumex salicifolius]
MDRTGNCRVGPDRNKSGPVPGPVFLGFPGSGPVRSTTGIFRSGPEWTSCYKKNPAFLHFLSLPPALVPQAPPSIFRLPSPSSVAGACVLLLLPAGASSSSFLQCWATREPLSIEFAPICVTKRDLALSLTAALFLPLAGNAAILEADDGEELLERVKKDRQKRIERQGAINSSKQETGFPSLCITLNFVL